MRVDRILDRLKKFGFPEDRLETLADRVVILSEKQDSFQGALESYRRDYDLLRDAGLKSPHLDNDRPSGLYFSYKLYVIGATNGNK